MCDIFTRKDVMRVLRGKSILFLGDSIMRNIYKDLVWLSSPKTKGEGFIPQQHMRDKGEREFLEDKLTKVSALTAARNYEEERDFYVKENDMQFSFIFITRCFSQALEDKILGYKGTYGSYPDLIIINSALWDINRWGPDGILHFKDNLHSLMKLFQRCLPQYTQVVWMTTPPISAQIRGGFMIQNLEFMKDSMRFNIMEGNKYSANVVASYGYDVLDMHYYMLNQIHRRAADGIHWNFDAVRLQSQIVLTHYCLAHDIPLPNNVQAGCPLLETAKEIAEKAETDFFHLTREAATTARKIARAKRHTRPERNEKSGSSERDESDSRSSGKDSRRSGSRQPETDYQSESDYQRDEARSRQVRH